MTTFSVPSADNSDVEVVKGGVGSVIGPVVSFGGETIMH